MHTYWSKIIYHIDFNAIYENDNCSSTFTAAGMIHSTMDYSLDLYSKIIRGK